MVLIPSGPSRDTACFTRSVRPQLSIRKPKSCLNLASMATASSFREAQKQSSALREGEMVTWVPRVWSQRANFPASSTKFLLCFSCKLTALGSHLKRLPPGGLLIPSPALAVAGSGPSSVFQEHSQLRIVMQILMECLHRLCPLLNILCELLHSIPTQQKA